MTVDPRGVVLFADADDLAIVEAVVDTASRAMGN
jgi:hypothetical protein